MREGYEEKEGRHWKPILLQTSHHPTRLPPGISGWVKGRKIFSITFPEQSMATATDSAKPEHRPHTEQVLLAKQWFVTRDIS